MVVLVILAGVVSCGGDAGGSADGDVAESAAGGLAICDVLSDEEVTQVLAGHDGGIVTSAGGSLVDGVDVYRCSYTAQREGVSDFDLLTVVVTTAANAELFDGVRPAAEPKRDTYSNFAVIDAGDGGYTYGDPDEMMVDVWQGTTAVTFELEADDAASHTDSLVALAVIVLSRTN